MSKTEEQAREFLDAYNLNVSLQSFGRNIKLSELLIKFANSQHEQLTKERDELKKESKSSLNRIIGDLTKELQAEKKKVEGLSKKIIAGYLFNGRYYKNLSDLRGKTMSYDNKPIKLYY